MVVTFPKMSSARIVGTPRFVGFRLVSVPNTTRHPLHLLGSSFTYHCVTSANSEKLYKTNRNFITGLLWLVFYFKHYRQLVYRTVF